MTRLALAADFDHRQCCAMCGRGSRVPGDQIRQTVGALGKPRPAPHIVSCCLGALPQLMMPGDSCPSFAL